MNILLGVSSSISAYKCVDILREFQNKGHKVNIVLSERSCNFVSPVLIKSFNPKGLYINQFDIEKDLMLHINLAKESDVFLVAPASANIIAKFACGIADDLLSTCFLAFYKSVIVAPAMNEHMLNNPATLHNLNLLKERGVKIIEPTEGLLACGQTGKGRLPGPKDIYNYTIDVLNGKI